MERQNDCHRTVEQEQPMKFECTIPGQPVPMGRPRVTTRGGVARAYLPKATRAWLDMASTIIKAHWRHEPMSTPVGVRACFVHRRPQKLKARRHSSGRHFRPVRGDVDNFLKALLDSLQVGNGNGGGVFLDDALVCYVECYDLYAARDEGPHVEVEVFPLTSPPPGEEQ